MSVNSIHDALPFVSVCTPTYNRRPFIKMIKQCFLHQKYPQERMEWVIIDDGTDSIYDLVEGLPNVKYYFFEKKMSLGKKRNIMHTKARGDIIVYMDDDDYYPPDRVSHAVGELMRNKEALCAGSSIIHIYFDHLKKIYQFGPYGKNHATAGTFAFKRELLELTKYDDSACLAEERSFLKDYTIPFTQLDPKKTILVFSHSHNTFDKRNLLDEENDRVSESKDSVDDFVKQEEIKRFFLEELEELLENYKDGLPSMKPDVLIYMKKLEEERKNRHNNIGIIIQNELGQKQTLNKDDIVKLLKYQHGEISSLKKKLQNKDYEIKLLRSKLEGLVVQDNNPTEILEPVDISYGMYLDIQEIDILTQINNIN